MPTNVARLGALLTIGLAGLMAAAAAQPLPSAPRSAAPEIDRTTAEYFYRRHCAGCHGGDGRGTLIGFPLVGRPVGAITRELLHGALRAPLQMMPSFPRNVVSEEIAELIAHHIAVLEHRASGAPVPPRPEVPASALRALHPLPPVPAVAPADPKTYEMREYESPCGAGHSVAVAPDGRVWFTGIQQHVLAVFDPRGERFRCWPIPTRNGRPHGVAVDKDGFVWFTITGLPDNKVAMFDPKTELFAEHFLPQRPQPYLYPHTLAFDAERNPVFSLEYGDGAGRIERRTGRFEYFPLPTLRARPYGIQVAKSGRLWIAEFTGNKIAEIDPKSGKASEHVHPRAAEDPGLRRLALDSKGGVWFSEHEFGSLGLFEPRSKRWTSWRAPANGGRPSEIYAVNVDRRDVIWFSHFGGNYVGRFDPKTEKFSVYPHVSAGMNCRLMDIAPDGVLWCMGSGAAKLMRLSVKPAGG